MEDYHDEVGATVHGSRSEPIKVPVRDDYLAWEYREIESRVGYKGKAAHQSLLRVGERLVDRLVVDPPEQGRNVFYFDVTDNIVNLEKMMEAGKTFVKSGPTPGRNDPCPCGSGQKYKKCCLGK